MIIVLGVDFILLSIAFGENSLTHNYVLGEIVSLPFLLLLFKLGHYKL